MKRKVIHFNEFMTGEYKVKEKEKRQKTIRKATKIATASILPVVTMGAVGTVSFAITAVAMTTSSAIPVMAPAVEVGAKAWMGQQALATMAHILDPVVDVLVALSFPIASVVIVGSCFYFMFGKSEKAWTGIQNAGLGYVLIQVSPLILDVLKKVGEAAV